MHSILIDALIALQAYVVVFIAVHDWVPLGSLNNVRGVHAADSTLKLVVVTTLSTLPFAFGLGATIVYASARFPGWLNIYLWVSYGVAVYGLIRAWWGPYLFYKAPARAARYQAMFGGTHVFLPERNGIRPNTLHVSLHLVILAIVGVLALLRVYRPS